MEWLWGAALLPLIVCGGMCLGGMVLAALGLGRASRNPPDREDVPDGDRSALQQR